MKKYIFFLLFVSLWACKKHTPVLMEKIDPSSSGLNFINQIQSQEGFDVFRYRNFYNGGGAAIADINNDGLSDIYLVSNQNENHLFLNQGDFKFKDITQSANVGGNKPWSTGVAIADVNGDGWLDIYVCNSGDLDGKNRGNELFINNQDGSFSEKAKEFGLDDNGFSTHAVFFDFDQDNDLDCYLLNNSFRPVSSLPVENTRNIRDTDGGGDKFFINDNGKFVDVSDSVGVFGSTIGFGLGITLLDINDDGFTDIYVSNDFFERDYLYVNVKGEKFEESLEKYFDQISMYSMGADAADLNNDGKEEIFVTDMLPKSSQRLKQTTSFETPDLFRFKHSKGFYNQFMRNTLQWGQSDGSFVEMARQKGVSASDWSWGALLMDLDNDGFREIFVANGVFKDVTDQDFIAYFANDENIQSALNGDEISFAKFTEKMPSNPIPNSLFSLDSTGNYTDKASLWGLGEPTFSNGAAYGDLDNDGDLDMVVNNLNQETFLYKNNANELTHNNFIRFELSGNTGNNFAVGTEIKLYANNQVFHYNHFPIRGFQSSMDYVPVIGLDTINVIDSVVVKWNSNSITKLFDVPVNQTLKLNSKEGINTETKKTVENVWLSKIDFSYKHQENNFDDFDFNRLLYHGLSTQGPALAVGDINGDGLDDFYIGGAMGFAGKLFLNDGNNMFNPLNIDIFEQDNAYEDIDAAFFDADGDGDLDLYVVSGGNEFPDKVRRFQDRLYLNEGKVGGVKANELKFTSGPLPYSTFPGSVVRPHDFDKDGDMDVFIGGRMSLDGYGRPVGSFLWENDGSGKFTDVTAKYISQLQNIGMVTDAKWFDFDNDDDQDLVVVGEWMPVVLFENKGNFFQRKFNYPGLDNTEGWWNAIEVADVNSDGFQDLILGNWGTNSMFKASKTDPLRLYLNDFDDNGADDPVYTFHENGKFIPFHLRMDMSEQMVFLKKKFNSYAEYANKSIDEIFTEQQLTESFQLDAMNLKSSIAYNQNGKAFELKDLPYQVQVSPVFKILYDDLNDDQVPELSFFGNFHNVKPEEGMYNANHGVVLQYKNQSWLNVGAELSGLNISGEVRNVKILKGNRIKLLIVAKNNDYAEIFSIRGN